MPMKIRLYPSGITVQCAWIGKTERAGAIDKVSFFFLSMTDELKSVLAPYLWEMQVMEIRMHPPCVEDFDPVAVSYFAPPNDRTNGTSTIEFFDGRNRDGKQPTFRMRTPTEETLFRALGENGEQTADMLTIRQAAEYALVDERTIRDWLKRDDGDRRMLPGAIKTGRIYRIPRTDLAPYRKAQKDTRAPKMPARKHPARKTVKPKS